ncbi:hypothetical protein M8C21_029371 [Ambrosia artemisiifolia]|uniref:Uncharacterized protein n=1 Tax=Ambrosia artemisiifolia TaxID=4212 RepID=A0AAD5BX99_AMBAR|nr:hypothetical protein M8C21_029371 [Ambrosia artemisiifolia]
MHKLSQNLPKN